ncbi:NADH-quinone oxidoreductase subunit NuoG [Parasedimentitalea huanghaiensis]|uniref:NADH-quinone oxidoreductase subunit NuoG n=1 Tax=Parasedimentitalea huanghaiensis TaxID=2682100 RepID=A0A6L6WED5_9RHOB|nr:NADH-quinone oxidoreductase subunit NuoG [Zongyanglinia huanghaiensis]MVO15611.1 NADH-quinone oxidoreductase subunit NuoG [Zongyanglinia huanghaiensis]
MVTITLDGQQIEVEPGTTILTAARSLAVNIPTFCYQERLSISASCRMCLVEVEGRNKLEPACATAVAPDMVIHSHSEKVVATREDMLEILLANHPLDCPICDKGGECELQDTVFEHGKGSSRLRDFKRVFRERDIELNKVIVFNANRCIQCQRCVRICEEVVGDVALGTAERGLDSEITGVGNSLKDCSHCGNCIEVCPVGALMSVPYRYKARPWDLLETETTCNMCGTGCSLTAQVRDGEFKRVKSSLDTGINGELLCAKGRFGFDAIDGGDRIQQPMMRVNGAHVPVSWNEAIRFIATKARVVMESGGGIQGHISPRENNETAYMFQNLMRRVFGSQDIHASTRFSGLRKAGAIEALAHVVTGYLDRKPFKSVLQAECVFLLGSNVSQENPVSGYLLRSAIRGGNKSLFIASSRPCGLDDLAAASMRLLPGNEAQLLGLLMQDEPKMANNPINGFVSVIQPTVARADSIAFLIGTEFLRSSLAAECLRKIAQVVDYFKAQGKTVYLQFLFDRPNQLGLWDMGCLDGIAPGWQRSASSPKTTENLPDLTYILGSDPLRNSARDDPAALSQQRSTCLVVHTSHYNKSAEQADVLLPATPYGEESGTYTNNEGRVQVLRPVREAAQNQPSTRQVFNLIAQALGQGAGPIGSDQLHVPIAADFPGFGSFGDTADMRMAARTSGWPISEGDTDAPVILPENIDVKGRRRYLITGDNLFQSGQYTARSGVLSSLDATPYVELNPGPGPDHAFEGMMVTLVSSGNSFTAPLKINRSFDKQTVFVAERFLTEGGKAIHFEGEYPKLVDVVISGPEKRASQV